MEEALACLCTHFGVHMPLPPTPHFLPQGPKHTHPSDDDKLTTISDMVVRQCRRLPRIDWRYIYIREVPIPSFLFFPISCVFSPPANILIILSIEDSINLSVRKGYMHIFEMILMFYIVHSLILLISNMLFLFHSFYMFLHLFKFSVSFKKK